MKLKNIIFYYFLLNIIFFNFYTIAGHTDISLLVSCLSLDSSAKIREFIRDLYGSKPEVSNFATEFIRRKDKMNNNERKRGKK